MSRRMRRPLLVVSLFLVQFSGCDQLHEPAIYNALDSAVELRVAWEDGKTSLGTIPAHEVVHLGRVDSPVREVTVRRDDEILVTVTGAQIGELARETDENVAGIVIEEGGVRALTETELKRIYGK